MRRPRTNFRDGLVCAISPCVSGRRTGATGARVEDVSGFGRHGTLTNGTPSTDWVTSEGRLALNFSGSDEYITATINVALTTRFTISMWIKSTDVNPVDTHNAFAAKWTASGGWILWEFSGNIRFAGNSSVGGASWTGGRAIVEDGKWHMLTGVHDGTNQLIYFDGILKASNTAEAITDQASEGLKIGGYSGGTAGNYGGLADDMLLHERPLGAQEVLNLWVLGRGGWAETRRQRSVRRAATPSTGQPAATLFLLTGVC